MAGRIQALGERNDLQDILPALDLLMLSSAFGGGFPNVIGEAMSCAVPAVATSVGDAPTIISGTGSVVPPRDPVALANAAIAFLARDGVARANQGEAARRRILENYRMSTMVERYERIYGAIAEGPTARARQMFQR
jgi:glycosyltransferase involved in cell wall biosynthesis